MAIPLLGLRGPVWLLISVNLVLARSTAAGGLFVLAAATTKSERENFQRHLKSPPGAVDLLVHRHGARQVLGHGVSGRGDVRQDRGKCARRGRVPGAIDVAAD